MSGAACTCSQSQLPALLQLTAMLAGSPRGELFRTPAYLHADKATHIAKVLAQVLDPAAGPIKAPAAAAAGRAQQTTAGPLTAHRFLGAANQGGQGRRDQGNAGEDCKTAVPRCLPVHLLHRCRPLASRLQHLSAANFDCFKTILAVTMQAEETEPGAAAALQHRPGPPGRSQPAGSLRASTGGIT